MSKQIESNLFIFSPLAVKHAGLYQQILRQKASFEQLGNRILREIKAAHAFRQAERVRELSRILVSIPIKEYQLIGQYYLVWCKCRSLEYHNEVLERIVEQTRTYKTQALLSRGTFEANTGQLEHALYFYIEALKTARTPSEYIGTMRNIAVLKAREGFHDSALKDLENVIPLIKHSEPRLYFDFLNSYAVELGESGRLYEARNITGVVLASPFAPHYPEWQETATELREGNRSFVAVSAIQDEHTEPQQPIGYLETEPQARVYLFPHRKEESPQLPTPEPITNDELESMSLPELKAMLLSLAYDKDATKDDYRKMLMASSLVQKEEGPKEIDLESESNLEEIILHWLHEETSPEQLTAVFSALRDCDSEFRRTTIMDRIISIAYKETVSGQTSESEWRERFEAKLTPNPYKGI